MGYFLDGENKTSEDIEMENDKCFILAETCYIYKGVLQDMDIKVKLLGTGGQPLSNML